MQKIKELREENGYTQEELGKLIGVQKSAISKYENGSIEPSLDVLKKLSEIFKVSIDEIVRMPTNESNETSREAEEIKMGVRYKSNLYKVRSVKEITLIAVEVAVGEGSEISPVRIVTELWGVDGKLIARIDPCVKTE